MAKNSIFIFPLFIFLVKTTIIYINNSINDELLSDGTVDFPFKSISSAFSRNPNISSFDFFLAPSPISYDFENITPKEQIINITAMGYIFIFIFQAH